MMYSMFAILVFLTQAVPPPEAVPTVPVKDESQQHDKPEVTQIGNEFSIPALKTSFQIPDHWFELGKACNESRISIELSPLPPGRQDENPAFVDISPSYYLMARIMRVDQAIARIQFDHLTTCYVFALDERFDEFLHQGDLALRMRIAEANAEYYRKDYYKLGGDYPKDLRMSWPDGKAFLTFEMLFPTGCVPDLRRIEMWIVRMNDSFLAFTFAYSDLPDFPKVYQPRRDIDFIIESIK